MVTQRRRWRGPESNRRHHGFQPCALPTELPRRARQCSRARKKDVRAGATAPRTSSWLETLTRCAAGSSGPRSKKPATSALSAGDVDRDPLTRTGQEHLGRVPVRDRDGDVLVRVLVEDDVARARVGERPRGRCVVAVDAAVELDAGAGADPRALDVGAREVQLDVAEAVDIEDGRADHRLADLRLGQLEPNKGGGLVFRGQLARGYVCRA